MFFIKSFRSFLFILAITFLFSGNTSAQNLFAFTGNLDGNQEVPANTSNATGFGRVTYDANSNIVNISVFYNNLSSGVTVGHVHGPAAPGNNAGVVWDLNPTPGQTSGSVMNAQFVPTDQNISDLFAGLMYFNIHTSNFSGGEIRGQIIIDSPYVAYLDGDQENPNVATPAEGFGGVNLNKDGSQGLATVAWSNLSGVATGAHIHQGASGQNGPVICDLSPPPLQQGLILDVLCNFTPEQTRDLQQGLFYFNIHTPNNQGGEIRGQIKRQNSNKINFDFDRKTDISIFRPSLGEWWYLKSSDQNVNAFQFGSTNDIPAPADFTGDGLTDIGFFRPSSGEWFVLRSEDNSFFSFPFGANGDIPVSGDFDGDGKADPAVFRPSSATWFINNSADDGVTIQPFGLNGDIPIVNDFDGDGRDDISIFRPTVAEWYYEKSTDKNVVGFQFGANNDVPVVSDYTGDGKSDIGFFRPSSGEWFILRSEDTSFFSFPFGTNGDIPAPGDFDGDGKADPAVFRPSNNIWFLQQSTAGFAAIQFGVTGDIPLPSK